MTSFPHRCRNDVFFDSPCSLLCTLHVVARGVPCAAVSIVCLLVTGDRPVARYSPRPSAVRPSKFRNVK